MYQTLCAENISSYKKRFTYEGALDKRNKEKSLRTDAGKDASKVVKYPREIRRNKDPASAWFKARSALTLGINGARIIRAMKFTKNMEVSSKSGVNWVRNAFWA